LKMHLAVDMGWVWGLKSNPHGSPGNICLHGPRHAVSGLSTLVGHYFSSHSSCKNGQLQKQAVSSSSSSVRSLMWTRGASVMSDGRDVLEAAAATGKSYRRAM